ncbi:GNAT family N-acetyltransferase [Citrobacter sp. NCU1]|uniref:GNAT family N-acetyltransferase n=1 Tax=Citrobacter sp. NCU1 TaxID=2026683 RepID=UPI0013913B61|nr:GNAT family N-acetyltransferase [Citrobacter sp. NCU1]NDO82991.1 GNAT family N-acetyltransferase [Citrobacter sp. NCU1]
MLTCKKITSTESTLFQRLDALYSTAFPWHEQREMHAKQQAIANPHYALEGWFEEAQFIGLSGCWTFDDYVYVEHLAIDGALRSQGYGKILLGQILARSPMTILEIDPLTTEIAEKRLRFYESMGFFANPWPHTHPAYHQGMAGHELIVLSYPEPITASHYARFNADLCHRVMAL